MEQSRIEKLELLQDQASQSWISLGGKGTLELPTGFGKTFCSFKSIYKALDLGWIKLGDKVLYLAETQVREKTILDDIKKFNSIYTRDFLNNFKVEFACYQSSYKWSGTHYNVVVADEVHDSLTKEYSKFYENNTWDYIVGLSATVDRLAWIDENQGITKGDLLNKYFPVCFKYTAKQARIDGILPPIKVYVIKHQLDTIAKVIPGGTKSKPFLTTEYEAYKFTTLCFQQALFMQEGQAKTFAIQNASRKRADLLYKLPSRIIAVNKLLSNIKLRTLVFGNSLEALHQITSNVVASKDVNGKTVKAAVIKQMLDDFEQGKIDTLASFKMLKQGANLPDLDMILLQSYYSKEKDMIQRLGRIRFREDFTGTVVIFVTEGTQEVKWFDKMMVGMDMNSVIYCDNVDQCINLINKQRQEENYGS